MSDIVERLNEAMFEIKDKTRISHDLWNPLALAICDVTDEIKRLREALSTIEKRFCRPEDQALLMDNGMPLRLFICAALGEDK